MLLPRQFLIRHTLNDGQHGLVLVAEDQPEEHAVFWLGPPPEQNLPPHPGLARRQVCANEAGEPGWLELTPAGVLLSALPAVLPTIEAAELFAAIADAIAALHEAGLIHGGLTADRIHIDRRCQPTLLGTGQGEEDDLTALGTLWQAWCPAGPLMSAATAAEAAEGLRVWLSVTEESSPRLPDLVDAALKSAPDGEPLTLQPGAAVGPVDEIGLDIGPDETPGGLLDPLTWSGITGEPTSEVPVSSQENTGAIHEDTRINTPRTALLSRLLGLSHEKPSAERFQEGAPSQAIRELIAAENLDPLPVPDGLPARPGFLTSQRDPEWDENTATAISDTAGSPNETTPPLDTDPAPTPEPEPEPSETPSKASELTGSMDVPNPLLALAVVMAVIAGAAALFFLLQQLQP